MPVTFNEDFWTQNGLQLNRPDLSCLRMNSMTYRTLLLQLREEIAYDDSGIWLADEARAAQKFDHFFNLAIENHIELAITPEYSCPWTRLEKLLQEEKFPTRQHLWVLGMASIHPAALQEMIASHEEVTWIFDRELLQESIQGSTDKFFDPLCYLFNTTDLGGSARKAIIVQFKNNPFGGADAYWERDNIILGNTFYVLRNRQESVRLITLICSDTLTDMNFNTLEEGKYLPLPLLILHIQLNQSPFSENYKLYRNQLFSRGDKDANKEVICLNWARKVYYNTDGGPADFNKVSGSAFYLKSTKLTRSDAQINANHKAGMYYTNWAPKRTHIYLLNFDEFVFLVENTKASELAADPTQLNRTGPKLLRTFRWAENQWEVQEARIDEGFGALVSVVEGDQTGSLSCLSSNENFLEVERMIQLVSGEISSKESWYSVSELQSFAVDDSELNNRVMSNQLGILQKDVERKRKLNNYKVLKRGIITVAGNLPVGMNGANLGYLELGGNRDRYLLNLHSHDGLMHATGIYLGSIAESDAKTIQKKVADLFTDSQYGKNVLVWHETDQGRMRIPAHIALPAITEKLNKKSHSIKKKKKR